MDIGNRLREERERLGMTQEVFGGVGGVLKRALIRYETGERVPDASFLAGVASAGADVLYIVTGQRTPKPPEQDDTPDPAEQVLLNSYRSCTPEARVNLIQTAALLSAGLGASKPTKASHTASNVRVGDQTSTHDGSVQVGYAGGNVRVKKS
ncbi:helix-turn-helix domain-containing protein [Comamonas thiooxydans]|uniref:helix-turn-helix domain-containing protein n=1 Tax=Comamonas thiooxydans TaxID=363952 RepID=UPI0011222C01|nr:helix-turn-helix domain-containing protein [Comamonas thiooxydans]BDR08600.1 helix-turn-helix domain-containing protein [Comamonas thiooxydans]